MAFVVVVLGAYTRLADAGLGCPDWPGCYGFLSVPRDAQDVSTAQARFPDTPVEAHKAWPEMIHRYFATGLGLAIVLCAASAIRFRGLGLPLRLPLLLLGLVALQGAFGAWTVTLKLWPQVVTAHLLGGMTTLALLWLLLLRCRNASAAPPTGAFHFHAALALAVVIVQIALGGWTTSNYAALACPDLPTCQGAWWPAMDFRHGFAVAQSVGPSYLGGLLEGEARIAIHMAHRIGAVFVVLVVGSLALRMLQTRAWRAHGAVLGALVLVQFALGVSNVAFSLPLAVATAHNATGALLLLASVSVNYRSFSSQPSERSEFRA